MLHHPVLAVLTHKSRRVLLSQGGTRAWRVRQKRVLQGGYVVCCRLHSPMDEETKHQPHLAAFMVGRVADIVPANGEPGRSLIRFREYADVLIKNVFPKQRSPIAYLTHADLFKAGVDITKLHYTPMPKPREPIEKIDAADSNPIVLIWSGEHRAWWRPSAQGYTTDRDLAGRYWLRDAQAETAHCGPEKQIEFHRASRPERAVYRQESP